MVTPQNYDGKYVFNMTYLKATGWCSEQEGYGFDPWATLSTGESRYGK